MGAIITFRRRIGFRIDIQSIIRAGLHTGFTSNATITIKIHNAVSTGVKRGGWTYFHTRRIGAMVTAMDRKFTCAVRKLTFFDIFNVSAVYTDRNIKFAFTRYRTGMTANTLPVIYNKSVIHKILLECIDKTNKSN
jgi:hypothetical protein